MRTALVVSGAGNFGFKVASALTYRSDVKVRIFLQPNSASEINMRRLRWLSNKDVEIIEGNLNDTNSLNTATKDVDAVISTVKGGPEIIIEGQNKLLEVSVENNVTRFIPSDYSLDYTKLKPTDHNELALKAKFAKILTSTSIEYTFILNGVFMEEFFSSSMNIFNFESETVQYWGDGYTHLDLTRSDDAAEYIAEAVFDPYAANKRLNLVSDIVTLNEVITRFNEATEYKFDRFKQGSIDDLKAVIFGKQKNAEFDAEYTILQDQWALFSGAAKLGEPDNARYRNVYPTIMLDYISIEL